MAVVGSTFVELHVVAPGLEKEIAAKVQAAALKAEKAAQITPRVNTAKAEAEASKLSGVMGNLQAKLRSVAEDGGPVSSRLAKIAEGAASLGPAALIGGLAVAALAATVAKGVTEFLSLTSEIRKFNVLTGAGAETSSRFVVALHELGIDTNRIGMALFRMSRQLGDANSALEQTGVQVARNKAGNVDVTGTFLNLADAVHNATDAGEKNRIAFAAFGRQGAALVPVLNRGREALEEFLQTADHKGLIFTDEDLRQARDFQISVRGLHTSFDALTITLGREFVPALADIVRSATDFADSSFVRTTFQGLAIIVRGAGQTVSAAARILSGDLGGALDALTGKTSRASDAQAAFAQDIADGTAEAQRQADQLQTLGAAITGYMSAQDAFTSSKRGLINAQQSEADAQDRVNDLMRTHGVDLKAVKSAQDGLRSSTDSLTDARQGLAEAERKLAEVQRGASPRELQASQLSVRQATNALTHAEKELADLRKHHRKDALAVSDAENQVEAAQLSLADSQDELTKTQNKGKEGSDDYVAAQKAVEDAEKRVEDATRSRARAAADLRTAQQGDPDFARNLARAQSDLAAAHESVVAAEHGQELAALKLNDAYLAQQDALTGTAASVDELLASWEALAAKFGVPLTALAAQFKGGGDPRVQVTDAVNTTSTSGGDPRVSTRGGRAGGGGVEGGYWYQINEDGTEFFKPAGSGTVVPIGAGRGGRSSNPSSMPPIHQHFHGNDPETQAQRAGYYVGRQIRTAAR